MRIGLPIRHVVIAGLIAPCRPAPARSAGEHFQVWPARAGFDDVVLLVGLAAVLALAGGDEVDLTPARRKGPRGRPSAAHPEQDQLGDIAEVEADAAPVAAAVLADFVPDEIGLVAEP